MNTCHLLPKLDEIRILLQNSQSLHILGLCETFLSESTGNGELHVDQYLFERKDRSHKAGGGLFVVYLSESRNYKRRLDLESSNIETIWLFECI